MSQQIKSNRALAKILGVSEGAIRKAEKSGRIQREPDGSWELDRVRAHWKSNTDSAKQRAASSKQFKPVPVAAVDSVHQTLRENGQPPGQGGTTYMQARTADMVTGKRG